MNWIGWSRGAILGALFGCVAGFFAYGALLRMSWEAPWIVGIAAGAAAAIGSLDQSMMRGLLIGTVAVWTAAIAQVVYLPPHPGGGIVHGLTVFHETLTLQRFLLFAACAAAAILLGAKSLRSSTIRVAGT
jgi:hypothetical protein